MTTWAAMIDTLDDEAVAFWSTFTEDEAEAAGLPLAEVREGVAAEHFASLSVSP